MKKEYIPLDDKQREFLTWLLNTGKVTVQNNPKEWFTIEFILKRGSYLKTSKYVLNTMRALYKEQYSNRNK